MDIEEVVGSIPSGSTTQLIDIARFSVSLNVPDISETCARECTRSPTETEIFGLWRRYRPPVSGRKIPFPWGVA